MRRPAKKLDIVAMTAATDAAARQVEDVIECAFRVQNDTGRFRRLAENLCRSCFYVRGHIGGAAMTTQSCAGCGVEQHFGNTATDALCPACAKKHGLCKRCGGDRDMRTKRRKWPVFQTQA